MDEPFSAVDPEVRERLQDELLRLQSELGKTIVFVTHDIDEAVRLGDRVAVFRQGGHLAQYDTPRELLARPADDFVASFVGRDRGYRGLSFTGDDGLAVAELDTLEETQVAAGVPAADGWRLALRDGQPHGWLRPGVARPTRTCSPGARCTGWVTRSGRRSTPRSARRPVSEWSSTSTGALLGSVQAPYVLELIDAHRRELAGG